MKFMGSRLILCVMAGICLAGLLEAGVTQYKTLTRNQEAIVAKGSSLSALYGKIVNSTDVTAGNNQIFIWAYHDDDDGIDDGVWQQVVFQIDEVNNTYPNSPGPDYYVCDTTTWVSRLTVSTGLCCGSRLAKNRRLVHSGR